MKLCLLGSYLVMLSKETVIQSRPQSQPCKPVIPRPSVLGWLFSGSKSFPSKNPSINEPVSKFLFFEKLGIKTFTSDFDSLKASCAALRPLSITGVAASSQVKVTEQQYYRIWNAIKHSYQDGIFGITVQSLNEDSYVQWSMKLATAHLDSGRNRGIVQIFHTGMFSRLDSMHQRSKDSTSSLQFPNSHQLYLAESKTRRLTELIRVGSDKNRVKESLIRSETSSGWEKTVFWQSRGNLLHEIRISNLVCLTSGNHELGIEEVRLPNTLILVSGTLKLGKEMKKENQILSYLSKEYFMMVPDKKEFMEPTLEDKVAGRKPSTITLVESFQPLNVTCQVHEGVEALFVPPKLGVNNMVSRLYGEIPSICHFLAHASNYGNLLDMCFGLFLHWASEMMDRNMVFGLFGLFWRFWLFCNPIEQHMVSAAWYMGGARHRVTFDSQTVFLWYGGQMTTRKDMREFGGCQLSQGK